MTSPEMHDEQQLEAVLAAGSAGFALSLGLPAPDLTVMAAGGNAIGLLPGRTRK
jgi:hypothetical protein